MKWNLGKNKMHFIGPYILIVYELNVCRYM